jgi:hypothetical protein
MCMERRLTRSRHCSSRCWLRALRRLLACGRRVWQLGRDIGAAEPAGISSVEVHGYVCKFELLQGVYSAFLVGGLGVGALGNVQVGD